MRAQSTRQLNFRREKLALRLSKLVRGVALGKGLA